MKWSALSDRPRTRLPCVPLLDHRMENDFCPPIPYTLGNSATSKSTDSLILIHPHSLFIQHVLSFLPFFRLLWGLYGHRYTTNYDKWVPSAWCCLCYLLDMYLVLACQSAWRSLAKSHKESDKRWSSKCYTIDKCSEALAWQVQSSSSKYVYCAYAML